MQKNELILFCFLHDLGHRVSMCRFTKASLCYLLALAALPLVNTAKAQSGSDVESFLPHDVAALALINQPTQVWNSMLNLPCWNDRHFLKALELADQWEFLSVDNQLELARFGTEFGELLAEVSKISVVVHEMPADENQQLHMSILFLTSQETREKLEKTCHDLNSFFATGQLLGRLLFQFMDYDQTPQLLIDQIGDWLVVSNSQADVMVMKRLYEEKANNARRNTLADFRRYQRIWKTVFPADDDSANMLVYANPAKIRWLFPKIDDDWWRAYQPGEVVAVLARCDLSSKRQKSGEQPVDLNSVGSFHPVATYQITVAFTEPLAGWGKLLNTSGKIDVWPPLPNGVSSIEANSTKPAETLDVTRSLMTDSKGPEAWQEYVDKMKRMASIDVENDLYPSSQGRFIVRYFSQRLQRECLVDFYRVADLMAMERYFDSLIHDWNRRLPKDAWLKQIPSQEGRFFSRDEKEHRAHSRDSWDEEMSDEEFEKLHQQTENDAYFHDQDWLIIGDRVVVEELVDQIKERQNNRPWPFLTQLDTQQKLPDHPYKFSLYSPPQWRVLYQIQYVKKHFSQEEQAEFWSTKPDEFGCRIQAKDAETAVVAIKTLVSNSLKESFGWQYYRYFWKDNNLSVHAAIGQASASPK
jgi:hypothetical protein